MLKGTVYLGEPRNPEDVLERAPRRHPPRGLPWRTPRRLHQHKSKSNPLHDSLTRASEPPVGKILGRPRKTSPRPPQTILRREQRKQQQTVEAEQLQLVKCPTIVQQRTSANGPQSNQSTIWIKRTKLPECQRTLPQPIQRYPRELPRIPGSQCSPDQ